MAERSKNKAPEMKFFIVRSFVTDSAASCYMGWAKHTCAPDNFIALIAARAMNLNAEALCSNGIKT